MMDSNPHKRSLFEFFWLYTVPGNVLNVIAIHSGSSSQNCTSLN